MKNSNTTAYQSAHEAREARVAYRIAARLSERAETLDTDIAERLRFAREKALARGQAVRTADEHPVVAVSTSGAALLGGGSGWWIGLGSLLPLVALAAGLLLIRHLHTEAQISAAAHIDAEFLQTICPQTPITTPASSSSSRHRETEGRP